jgi:hypothetical protein
MDKPIVYNRSTFARVKDKYSPADWSAHAIRIGLNDFSLDRDIIHEYANVSMISELYNRPPSPELQNIAKEKEVRYGGAPQFHYLCMLLVRHSVAEGGHVLDGYAGEHAGGAQPELQAHHSRPEGMILSNHV